MRTKDPRHRAADRGASSLQGIGPRGSGDKNRGANQREADDLFSRARGRRRRRSRRGIWPSKRSRVSKTFCFGDGATSSARKQRTSRAWPHSTGRHGAAGGYALPFHFYDTFMKTNGGFTTRRGTMLGRPRLQVRRGRTREAAQSVPQAGEGRADAEGAQYSAQHDASRDSNGALASDAPIRCRSSTNNEDLPGFNSTAFTIPTHIAPTRARWGSR